MALVACASVLLGPHCGSACCQVCLPCCLLSSISTCLIMSVRHVVFVPSCLHTTTLSCHCVCPSECSPTSFVLLSPCQYCSSIGSIDVVLPCLSVSLSVCLSIGWSAGWSACLGVSDSLSSIWCRLPGVPTRVNLWRYATMTGGGHPPWGPSAPQRQSCRGPLGTSLHSSNPGMCHAAGARL